MKTILIATDFSIAADNAVKYSVQLARAFDAKIILFSSYVSSVPDPYLNFALPSNEVQAIVEERLKKIALLINSEEKILAEFICKEGIASQEIIDTANEKSADFIIAGMKGEGKNLRKIFGSTATELAEKSNIPVIIIPEDVKFTIPESIVFASDLKLFTNVHAIDPLMSIVNLFNSKLYVVKVVKADKDEWYEVIATPRRLRSAVSVADADFEYLEDKNISHALDKYMEEHSVKMLAMMPHKKDWIEKIFRKSETKDMIFHAHVPVLILPEILSDREIDNSFTG